METMNIYQALAAIQAELKAPKSQYNQFGGYKYRKCEDILEAVKPLLAKYGCVLTITDNIVYVEGRHYVEATATLQLTSNGQGINSTALAREEESKKGMDGSQVTGASSSYARKYALNGLLAIDDTADSDTTNQGDSQPAQTTRKTKKAAEPKAQAQAQAQAVDNRHDFPAGAESDPRLMDWLYTKRGEGADLRAALLGAYKVTEAQIDAVLDNFNDYIVNNNLA